jgi:hypothetical protein
MNSLAPQDTPKRKLRWYQFSLRSLLIFTFLVAIACSWLAVKMHQAKRREKTVNAMRKMGFCVKYDYEDLNPFVSETDSEPSTPAWLRNLLGDHFFDTVICIYALDIKTDNDMQYLNDLPHLKILSIRNSFITDARLKYINGLTQLEDLDLSGSTITDSDLHYFENLKHLETLDLTGTKPTDVGIERLKKALPNLDINKLDI